MTRRLLERDTGFETKIIIGRSFTRDAMFFESP